MRENDGSGNGNRNSDSNGNRRGITRWSLTRDRNGNRRRHPLPELTASASDFLPSLRQLSATVPSPLDFLPSTSASTSTSALPSTSTSTNSGVTNTAAFAAPHPSLTALFGGNNGYDGAASGTRTEPVNSSRTPVSPRSRRRMLSLTASCWNAGRSERRERESEEEQDSARDA